jgi:hypothetical protein
MELWRELLISGLQNGTYEIDFINDKIIQEIIESQCYKVLLQIKQTLDDKKLLDNDCFFKIEAILCTLEKNNVFCDRHDFG